MRPIACLTLSALLALPAAAQYDDLAPLERVPYVLDVGPAEALGDDPGQQVVLAFPVEVDGALSLRLHFDGVELAPGAELRVTSLQDGAVQHMQARHVAQWQDSTAYFNGSAVQVEVLAWPGTGPSRLRLSEVEVGVPLGGFESQCGPTDDRVPSNDPRVARLMPVVCTAWMITDCAKCFLSAGHCGSNSSVQFNVPFSTSGGGLVFPPPEDQYAIDTSSYQSNNSFGNDWQYFGTFPNSNTGLTAYEAMGDAFDLVDPPSTSGNTIRITGYGSDSTPNLTYDNIQQTHAGPYVSSGSPLQYQADTTGGTSGSPIIWEQQDVAIGVHTNAGCSTSGGGANQGTNILTGALQNALANPQGVCAAGGFGGAFTNLGNALGQHLFSAPFTAACGSLEGGSTLEVSLQLPNLFNVDADLFLVMGFSQVGAPFKGGVMVPSPDLVVPFPVDTTVTDPSFTLSTTWPTGVPSGFVTYLQWWVSYTFFFGTDHLASNGMALTAP